MFELLVCSAFLTLFNAVERTGKLQKWFDEAPKKFRNTSI